MTDDPMSLGLLASANVDRAAAVRRLRDLRQPYGWGLGYAWDAFADGSVNPASTSYAITNAFVLQGLLDAEAVEQADAELAVAWAAQFVEPGGFYRYSEHAHDAVDTPNASAMWAGVCRRLLIEHPELAPDARGLVLGQADRVVRHLVELARPGPWWEASARRAEPDDLMHHGYTLWGCELYRAWGGSVHLPWRPDVAAARMRHRSDARSWPAAGPAMRFAYAVTYAPQWAAGADLEAEPGHARDAAHQTWARSLA